MKRKIAILLMLTLIFSTVLAGCGKSEAPAE